MATLDQPAHYEQLVERRPELMTQHGESVHDPAWQALVIRPGYREEILSTRATYADILAREYTPDLHTRDADGYSYKAFVEVADFEQARAPDRYVAFSWALEKSGFKGDSKIDLRPGQVRFQYNNVIAHAATAAMAQCAELVGLAFFGESVLHAARGVDAPPGPGEKATDWHHHLLRGGFARPVGGALSVRSAPRACRRSPSTPSSCCRACPRRRRAPRQWPRRRVPR